jgi:hypothetical protein
MSSYNRPNAAPTTVQSTITGNAAEAFASPSSTRVGYAVCNPSTSVKVYVQERPSSDTTIPTAAQVIAAPSYIVQTEQTVISGARGFTRIFIASSGSQVDTQFQELIG